MITNSSNIDSILSRQVREGLSGMPRARATPSFADLMHQAEDAIVQAQLNAIARGAVISPHPQEIPDASRYASTTSTTSRPRAAGEDYAMSRVFESTSMSETTETTGAPHVSGGAGHNGALNTGGTLRISGGPSTGSTWIGRVGPELTGTITSANLSIGRIGGAPSNTITFATTPATPALTMSWGGFEALKGLAAAFQQPPQASRCICLYVWRDSILDKVTGVQVIRSRGTVTVNIPRRLGLLAEVLDSVTLGENDLADPKKSAEFFRSIAAKYAELAEEAAEEKVLGKDVQPGTAAGTSQMDLF